MFLVPLAYKRPGAERTGHVEPSPRVVYRHGRPPGRCRRPGVGVVTVPWFAREPARSPGQATEHAIPLSVNAVGRPVSPVCVAWKPKPADAPAAIVAL